MAEGADIQTVSKIAPQHRALEAPEFLRELPSWLLWKYEHHRGEPKPRKVPFYCDGGRRYGTQGSPQDRAKLTTFAAASAAAARRGMDGVGFALLPDWGIVALDFDKCVSPDGSIPEEIAAIVGRTYAEFSPSGEGVRAFVKGNLGNHKDQARDDRFGFEVFSTNGFVTLTANILPVCELIGLEDHIADVDDAVLQLCDRRFGSSDPAKSIDPDDFMAGREPRIGMTPEEIEQAINQLDPGMGREDWLKIGMALHHETEGDDTGFDLWDEWSAIADNYASREDLQKQWDSFTRRQGDGAKQVTMRSVLKMVKDLSKAASADDLRAAAEEGAALVTETHGVRTPDSYAGKFPIATAAMLAAQPPTDWLVKGIIPRADLVILFGASTAGKSFVAIDIGAAIARGVDWRGRRVKKGRVVLIAAEGSGGIGKRLQAYCQIQKIDADDLEIGAITVPPDFCEKEDIAELVKAIVAAGGADMIIVDTLAQVTPGANENSGEDMGLALANARALRDATGAVVMLVAHSGKDASRGVRGWSGQKAAADAEIEILRHENGDREIHLSKMKDGEDGIRLGFKLEVISLGIDSDGDSITSCVVAEADLPQAVAPEDKQRKASLERLGGIERHIMECAETWDTDESRAPYGAFVERCVSALEQDEGKRDTRRQRVVRAIETLARKKDGPLAVTNGHVIFYI